MRAYCPRLSAAQRRLYRAEVERALAAAGLSSYTRSSRGVDPQVLEALARTAQLLRYESDASPAHSWFASRLRDIRVREWKGPRARYRYPRHSPRTMLSRVLEFYTLTAAQPGRYPTANDEHEALGRAFLMTSKGQPTNHSLRFRAAGKYIAGQLGAFAIQFTARMRAQGMLD